MKILMVSHEYPPIGGGGSNACRFLGNEFVRRGHETVLVTVGWGAEAGTVTKSPDNGVEIHRLKCKRKQKEHCSFMEMSDFVNKALVYCGRLCSQKRFDICLIFFGIPSGVVGRYLKSRYALPYVIRFGGGDIPGFQERFKAIYGVLGPFVKNIWKHSSGLVANSSGLKDFAERFCDMYPISVVPNGVDIGFYGCIDKEPAEGGEVRLLFVSRLLERKGLQHLIPHLKDISEACGRKVTLTIVGDGPFREELVRCATQAGTLDMIRFEGQKDKEEIAAYFGKADMFVFPSRREGMPNAVLEAMAGGLPVIMTNCEGAAELIDGNGIIADSQEAFYKCVIEAVQGGNLEEMGGESLRRAKEVFSWESTAGKYLEIFSAVRR